MRVAAALLATLLAAPLATLLAGCGGPLLAIPGGALAGEPAAVPASWGASHTGVLELETRPGDPYSVQVNYVVRDGRLYVDPADGRRWLVNRGFLVGDPGRRALPVVETPAGHVTLTGLVWPELGLLPIYGDDEWDQDWPKVVQQLEVDFEARTPSSTCSPSRTPRRRCVAARR